MDNKAVPIKRTCRKNERIRTRICFHALQLKQKNGAIKLEQSFSLLVKFSTYNCSISRIEFFVNKDYILSKFSILFQS